MSLKNTVEYNYFRLELEREQDLAPTAAARLPLYHQWAHGRVLLDHRATLDARRDCADGEGFYARMLDQVRGEIIQMNERILVPALSYDDKQRYIVLLVIAPQ